LCVEQAAFGASQNRRHCTVISVCDLFNVDAYAGPTPGITDQRGCQRSGVR
jgi:hypothetical protein